MILWYMESGEVVLKHPAYQGGTRCYLESVREVKGHRRVHNAVTSRSELLRTVLFKHCQRTKPRYHS